MDLNINETNVYNIAAMIFEGTRWEASDEDIQLLANNFLLLEKRGLSKLNKRLVDSGRRKWDTFAEHNFAYELVCHHPSDVLIQYEPDEIEPGKPLGRPPDFMVVKEAITFWIQMKKLARSERENRQSKAMEQIKRLAMNIKVGKFFWCDLSEDFRHSDVEPLIDFISEIAENSFESEEYFYPSSDKVKVKVTFRTPKKSTFGHLTLGGWGDLDCVDVTGTDRTQIKSSLKNAAGAFRWNTDDRKINLIAIEVSSHHTIDLGEAVFGNEVFVCAVNGKRSWYREDNGFFEDTDFCSKVAGVIALSRKQHRPVSRYNKSLFVNNKFKDRLEEMKILLDFDKVIFFNHLLHDD